MKTRPCVNSDQPDFQNVGRLSALAQSERESSNDQIIYSGLITLAAAILAIARWLRPSSDGYGTHQQLGLPPCAFFKLTGIPCPNCGMTTSFAHAAHLHFYQALLTQPFGLVAFCLTLLSLPFLAYLMRRQIAWNEILHRRSADTSLYLLLTLYLLSWLYKIAVVKMLIHVS